MNHIIHKKLALIMGIFTSLLAATCALAEDPLKIDVDMANASCKAVSPDMVQCNGIKALWTDPASKSPQSAPVNAAFQWNPLTYAFQIKTAELAQCTLRVQVANVTSGEPLANTSVSFGDQTKTTDEDGIAKFVTVPEETYNIVTTRSDYNPNTISINLQGCSALPDKLQHVAVRLMPKL